MESILVNILISIFFIFCLNNNAQDSTRATIFVKVYLPYVSDYAKALPFTAYFSSVVEQDMSDLLAYPSISDINNKSILTKCESKLLECFYNKGLELIGLFIYIPMQNAGTILKLRMKNEIRTWTAKCLDSSLFIESQKPRLWKSKKDTLL